MGFSCRLTGIPHLAAILLSSTIAFAQTTFPPPQPHPGLLRDYFERNTGDSFKAGSPSDAQDESAGQGKMQGFDDLTEPVDDYGCPNGNCSTSATTSQFMEGSDENYPVAAMVPPTFGAVTDNLWSPTATNIIKNQMSAATIVQAAAIALTEPAVMAGLDFAMRNSMDYHKLNLLTGSHAADGASIMPAAAEFYRLYVQCMQTTYEKLGLSYSESQARCLRDAANPSKNSLLQGQPGGAPILNMNFGTDTPAAQAAKLVPTPNKKGRLSNLLFDQHIYTLIPGTVSHSNVNRLKADFTKFYGDVEFTIDANTTGNVVSPRLTSKIETVSPAWTAGDHLNLRMHERWDLIRTVLWSYCDWYEDHSTNVSANNGPTDLLPVNAWGDLFSSTGSYKISTEILQKISAPGYIWTAQEFDIMFREIEREPKFYENCDFYFGNGAAVLPYCPFTIGALGSLCISPFPTTNFNLLMTPLGVPTTRKPYTITPIEDFLDTKVAPTFENKTPELFRMVYFAARLLSRMEILHESILALTLVRAVSSEDGSAMGGTLRERAEELIFMAAKSRDPERSLEEVQQKLTEYLDNKKKELERDNSGELLSVGHIPVTE